MAGPEDLLGGDWREVEREFRRLAGIIDDNTRAVDRMQRAGGASPREINRALAEGRLARERGGVAATEPTARGRRTADARLRQVEADFNRAARATEQFARRSRDALLGLGYRGVGPQRQLAGLQPLVQGMMRDISAGMRAEAIARRRELAGLTGGSVAAAEREAARREAAAAQLRRAGVGTLAPAVQTDALTRGITRSVSESLRAAEIEAARQRVARYGTFPSASAIGQAVGRAVTPILQRGAQAPPAAAAGGGGAGGIPPRGTTLAAGGGPPDDGGRARRQAVDQRALNQELATGRQRLSYIAAAQAQASSAMRRHGALTTEFVSAAARGAVTMRELGFQLGATTAKFGGWLVAGAAVFTVLDAIRDVGRGAIESASGVNQLARVMPDLNRAAAAASFRDLAGQFQLPIADVADAAFQMGKVFRDQDDAMEATAAVLYSVRVGELSVADASRFLIATINGFQLPASRMATLFDQINQAQNRFGVQIRETEAGLAKASGTFRAAGGDVTTLIALLTTAQKVTGQTGEVVGTALARAPHFLRMEQNVQTLRDFGIDATAPIPEIFKQAFERARHLSGQELQLLAAAIGGPQWGARVFTGLLANADKFQEVMRQVNVEAARGSGQRELQTQLQALNEEIANIGIQLERFGSALESSGALTLLELMVKALAGIAEIAGDVVGAFAELPDGLTAALAVGGQLYLLLRLMRRLRFGDFLAGGPGRQRVSPGTQAFFNEDPRRYETRLYRQGLAQHATTLQGEMERNLSGFYRAQQQAMITATRTAPQLALVRQRLADPGYRALDAEGQRLNAERTRTVLLEQERALLAQQSAARTAVMEAEIRHVAMTQELTAVEAAQAEAALRRNRLRGAELAAARGTALPGTLAVGTVQPPPYFPGRTPPVDPAVRAFGSNWVGGGQLGAPPPPSGVALPWIRGADQFGIERAREQARTVREMDRSMRRFGTSGRVLGGAMVAFSNTARSVGASVRGVPSAIRGAGAAFARLAAMLGPLDLALIGLVAGLAALDAKARSAEETEEVEKELRELGRLRAVSTAAGQRALLQRAREIEEENKDAGFFGTIKETAGKLSQYAPGGEPFYESDRQERLRQARETIEAAEERAARQAAARREGRPVPEQFLKQVEDAAERDARQIDNGLITLREYRQRVEKRIEEAGAAQAPQRSRAALQERLRTMFILRGESDLPPVAQAARAWDGAVKAVEEDIDGLLALSGAGVASRDQLNKLMALLLMRGAQTRGKSSLKARERYAEVGEQLAQVIQDQIDQLDQSLAGIDDEGVRNAMRRRGIARIRRTGIVAAARQFVDHLERQRQRALARLRNAQREVDALERAATLVEGGNAEAQLGLEALNLGAEALQGARARAGAARATAGDLKRRREAIREVLRDFRDQSKSILDEAGEQGESQEDQLFDLRTQIQANRIAVGPARTAYILQRAGEAVTRAIQEYGEGSVEALQAIVEQQDAQSAHLDSLLAQIEGQNELAAARAYARNPNDRRAEQRAELAGLQRVLAFYQAHRTQYADRIPGVMAQIIRLRTDIAQQIEEDASEYLDALLEYRQSQTGSELRRARLEYRFARRIAREAPGDTPAERLRQRARINNARRAMLELESQEAIDRIQFQQDIGKLTTYQAIRQYQELLKTAKLSRDMRRDLRRRIYQLNKEIENENQFDLQVGQIRLPTAYDIRRTIGGEYRTDAWREQGGAPRAGMAVQNNQTNNNISLVFNGPVDAREVFDELERRLGSSVRGSARAAGQGVYTLA